MKCFAVSIIVVLISVLTDFIHSYPRAATLSAKPIRAGELFSSRSRTDGKKADGQWQGGNKSLKIGPLRNGEQINYVAEWQAKGDHYVSYDNLLKLDGMMSTPASKTRSDKSSLLSELSLTYFAR